MNYSNYGCWDRYKENKSRGFVELREQKNKMAIKSAEMKLIKTKQKKPSNPTNKYVTQQTNEYINAKKMSI